MTLTAPALISESPVKVPVTVGREGDVKFIDLCEQRGIPVTRIGVTDTEPTLEIQHIASWPIADLKSASEATLPELFA
jgi:phosphoribosylformylglycinamidine synthase